MNKVVQVTAAVDYNIYLCFHNNNEQMLHMSVPRNSFPSYLAIVIED